MARTSRVGELLSAVPHAYYPESESRDDLELGAAELARALAAAPAPEGAPHSDPAFYLRGVARWATAYLKRPGAGAGPLDVYDVAALAPRRARGALPRRRSARHRSRLAAALRSASSGGKARRAREPFGLGLPPGGFDTAPHALGYAVTADRYEQLTGSREFRAFGQRQLDWVLGANAWGASFVVGAGRSFPRCMQSQIANLARSLHGHTPLQLGATVGGPNSPDVFEGLGLARARPALPARRRQSLSPLRRPRRALLSTTCAHGPRSSPRSTTRRSRCSRSPTSRRP